MILIVYHPLDWGNKREEIKEIDFSYIFSVSKSKLILMNHHMQKSLDCIYIDNNGVSVEELNRFLAWNIVQSSDTNQTAGKMSLLTSVVLATWKLSVKMCKQCFRTKCWLFALHCSKRWSRDGTRLDQAVQAKCTGWLDLG